MLLSNPQEIKILNLYEMLRQHTDKDCQLSANQLCTLLESKSMSKTPSTVVVMFSVKNRWTVSYITTAGSQMEVLQFWRRKGW